MEITVGHSLPRTSGWCSCTRYRGHPAGVVVYNCWPPLPYHHPHFSGPPSSSSHPLHYPGNPYYGNPVASETSVRSADKSSVYMAITCSLQFSMTHGRSGLLLDPPHSWSWRDRSDTNNSVYLSRWGGRRFRTTVQRWIDTIFGGWHYFFWLPAAVDRR